MIADAVLELQPTFNCRTVRDDLFGYGLENDWDLVPGTWTFEIRHDGTTMASERFELVE